MHDLPEIQPAQMLAEAESGKPTTEQIRKQLTRLDSLWSAALEPYTDADGNLPANSHVESCVFTGGDPTIATFAVAISRCRRPYSDAFQVEVSGDQRNIPTPVVYSLREERSNSQTKPVYTAEIQDDDEFRPVAPEKLRLLSDALTSLIEGDTRRVAVTLIRVEAKPATTTGKPVETAGRLALGTNL